MDCCEFFIVAFTVANATNSGYNSMLEVGLERVESWMQANSNKVKLPNFVYPLDHSRSMWIPFMTCSQGSFLNLSDLKKSRGNVTFYTVNKTSYIGLYLNMDSLNLEYRRCQFAFLGMTTTTSFHWTVSNAIVRVVISFQEPGYDCKLQLYKVQVVHLGKIMLAQQTSVLSRTMSNIVHMITSVFKNSVIRLLEHHLKHGITTNLPKICKKIGDYYSMLSF